MRPLWLSIAAFGPFAGREEIDFRPATEAGLFGIYGPTGSGKSSIFNAITFALFGEATREEHDAKALRSDHAPDDLLTEVKYLFELAGRQWLVMRAPEQMRPALKGGGLTRAVHRADLFDATGLSVEAVAAGATGKIVQERKVREVGEAVCDLLGYGPREFRSIVLLPQGRFEAFLAAKTDERKKILKELFDTRLFEQASAKLKTDAAEAKKAYEAARAAHDEMLRGQGFEGLEALEAGTEAAQRAVDERTEAQARAKAALLKASEAFDAAKTREAAFAACDKAAEDLRAATVGQAQAATRQADLDALEKAARVQPAADRLKRERSRLSDCRDGLDKALKAADEAKAEAKLAAERLEQQEAQAAEIEDLSRRVDDLARHGRVLQGADDLLSAAQIAQEAETQARDAQKAEEQAQHSRKDERRRLSDTLKEAREHDKHRQALTLGVSALEAERADAAAHGAAADKLGSARRRAAEAAKLLETAEKTHAEAKRALENAEAARDRDRAAALAVGLAPDTPCPVCGGREHPAPAMLDQADAEAAAGLDDARSALEDATQKLNEAQTEASVAADRVSYREETLNALPPSARLLAEIDAALVQEKSALGALPPQADIPALEAEEDALTKAVEAADAALEDLRESATAAQSRRIETAAAYAAALKDIPETLRDASALEQAQGEAADALNARRKALEQARATAQDARNKHAERLGLAAAARNALHAQDAETAGAAEAFEAALAKETLSAQDYEPLAPRIAEREGLRAQIETLRDAFVAASSAAQKADVAVAGLERPDMAAAETARSGAFDAADQALEALRDAKGNVQRLVGLQDQLAQMRAENDARDAATARLRRLSELCNGQNAQKLDLETFALGARFDLALAAANARLGPMTAGRYSMRKRLEPEGKGAKSGLGIEVFDLHTGKARPPSGLSGGEGFIHALALALGLADVVEREGGKVRLDTIFIDEGFGSLDADQTLGEVLDALTALTGGMRSVGLISHVQQVQEAAPAGFTLRKTAAGSTIEARSATG